MKKNIFERKEINKNKLKNTKTFTVTLLISAILILSSMVTTSMTNSIDIDENKQSQVPFNNARNSLETPLNFDNKVTSDIIFQENFEDQWVPDSNGDLAPPDWEVENNSEGYNYNDDPMFWYQGNETVNFGIYCATVGEDDYLDNSTQQDEWLISPEIILEVDCLLEFDSSFMGTNMLAVDHDYVKINDSSGWQIIDDLSFNYENNNEWLGFIYDLSNYTGKTIQIAFHRYVIEPVDENVTHYWKVDNIYVSMIPFNDVGVISIDNPISGSAGIFTPEATIENFGTDDEIDVPVNFKIYKIDGGVLEYDETEYVDIDEGETLKVEFPEWTPDDWQWSENVEIDYELSSCTMRQDDENESNNCSFTSITLQYPYLHDVGVISIDSPPESGDAQTFPVEATVKNFGQFTECCFKTYLEIAEINYNNPSIFIEEHFDIGYYAIPSGWSQSSPDAWFFPDSDYAGGIPSEMFLPWYMAYDGCWIASTPVDTTDAFTAGKLDLEFKCFIEDYASGYDLIVEIRSDSGSDWIDITPWTNPIFSNIGPETFLVNTSEGIGTATEIRWRFSGDPDDLNYWYIDDVFLYGYTISDPEYSEFVCLDDIEPGGEQEIAFTDWTPAAIAEGITGTRTYIITSWSNMCDPPDENAANDAVIKNIELNFFHDVSVEEITSPSPSEKRGASTTTWLHYDDGNNEDALGLVGGGTFEFGIRLTPEELGIYDDYEISTVRYHHGWEGGSPFYMQGAIKIYEAGTPTQPGELITSEDFEVITNDWYEIELSSPVPISGNEDIWVSVEATHDDGEYPAGFDGGPAADGKGDWLYFGGDWEEIQNIGYDYNWNIWAGLTATGPQTPDIYIKGGTHPVEALIGNLGTFPESNLFTYANITKEGDPVYDSNYTIPEIDAFDEETAMFDDWTVSEKGTYMLKVNITLDTDDFPDNNINTLVIGVDIEPPETTHTLDPANPDGENDWYINCVEITLEANDDWTGVAETLYKTDSGPWQTYTGPFDVCNDGGHTVSYYSVDAVGNEENPNSINFKIDKTKPTIEITKEKTGIFKIQFTAYVEDTTSGIDKVEWYLDDELVQTDTTEPYEYLWQGIGDHTVEVIAYDNAGHTETGSSSTPFNIPNVYQSTQNTQNTQSSQSQDGRSNTNSQRSASQSTPTS